MNIPNGSEISIGEWLDQIGAAKQFVGSYGEGPPDWEIQYKGDKIAVEVTLLQDTEGWGTTREKAFERELIRLIKEVPKEVNQRWHARCEYDPTVRRPPSRKDSAWKNRVREALRSPDGGEFQLLSAGDVCGRGVVLVLYPAGNDGSFAGAFGDEGCAVEATLTERIVACVRGKVKKIRKSEKAGCYRQWWLVFDDDILIAPKTILLEDETRRIEACIQECQDALQLSKIVLVSRYQTAQPHAKQDKWFYALREDPRHPPLPPSSFSDTTVCRKAT